MRHDNIQRSIQVKSKQGSTLSDHGFSDASSSEASAHWFLSGTCLNNAPLNALPGQAIKELKSFDDFGLLSGKILNQHATKNRNDVTHFPDQILSAENTSTTNSAVIPTTADPSELGGSCDSCEIEQVEEMIDQGYDLYAVLREMSTVEGQIIDSYASQAAMREDSKNVGHDFSVDSSANDSLVDQMAHAVPVPSSSVTSTCPRFDPDSRRNSRATAEEIIFALHSKDMPLLRSILMEKKWPYHRSIGYILDQLFEFIIRESSDTDEAVMFLRDFAVCNRRGYLHDIIGVRLALRVACESGSVSKAIEMLGVFRNMFLVKSPQVGPSKCHSSICLMDEFYTTLFSIGSVDEVEEAHRKMITLRFDRNSNAFIRCFTEFMLGKREISYVFNEWKHMSSRLGSTCAAELLWEGIFTKVTDPNKQAWLAGQLLAHCRQHDHPYVAVVNLIITLLRLKNLDEARSVFVKVAVPGRFFKQPLSHIARYEDCLETIENFASLMTECMFSEKRTTNEEKISVLSSKSVLTPELSSVLDSFYGVARKQHKLIKQRGAKRRLYRVDDEQLYELAEHVQLLWLKEAEKSNNVQSVDRLTLWSTSNNLELSPNIRRRIASLKGIEDFEQTSS